MAARYRMSVVEFAVAHQIDFGLSSAGGGWLLMLALKKPSVDALAALTRISKARIRGIAAPSTRTSARRHFYYCARCVFLNPLDVASPIWRVEWFDPSLSACPRHGDEFRTLHSGSVFACKNMDQLLALVSRQERDLRNGTYTSRASRVHDAASIIR